MIAAGSVQSSIVLAQVSFGHPDCRTALPPVGWSVRESGRSI